MESPVPEKAWDFLKAVDGTLTGRLCWLLLLVHTAMHQLLFQREKNCLFLSILFLAQMMESALRVFAQLFDAMSLLGLKSHFQVFEGIYPETVSY